MKNLFYSRTFWLAVVQGVMGILVVVETQYGSIGWLAIVKSAVDIFLRMDTSAPVKLV